MSARPFRMLRIAPGLALLCLFGSACAPRVRPDVVAEIDGRAIGCNELRRFTAALQANADPVAAASQSVLVEELVLTELLASEGDDGGDANQRALRWQQRQQLAERAVAAPTATPEAVADPETGDAAVVGDAEVAAYYESHQDEFVRPERIRTRLILVRLDAGATASEERTAAARLREIQAKFLSGTPFPDLAVRFSEADNAAFGGDVGAKARGEMPAAFESVAWGLEPGEVSDIVRLPEGLGLLLLEEIEPPRSAQLDEVREEIRAQLSPGQAIVVPAEEVDAVVPDSAVLEARARWHVTIDREALLNLDLDVATTPVVRIGDDALSLADLGLTTRPPGVDAALAEAIDIELLARLAASQGAVAGLAVDPAPAKRHQAAMAALERRVDERLPESAEAALRQRYDAAGDRFARSERRLLEIVRVMAESGDLRSARAAAEALGRVWRPGTPAPQRHRAEVWGPIEQQALAQQTSNDLAGTAFALDPGVVSPPLLVEDTWPELAYVLLRVARVEPAGLVPYAEVRATLAGESADGERAAIRAEIRTELLRQAKLQTLPSLFECNLAAPVSPAAAQFEVETTAPARPTRGWPSDAKRREAGDR